MFLTKEFTPGRSSHMHGRARSDAYVKPSRSMPPRAVLHKPATSVVPTSNSTTSISSAAPPVDNPANGLVDRAPGSLLRTLAQAHHKPQDGVSA
jgi:hypothetical protein